MTQFRFKIIFAQQIQLQAVYESTAKYFDAMNFLEMLGAGLLLLLAGAVFVFMRFMKRDADGGIYGLAVPKGGFAGKCVLLVGASSGSE